MPLKTRTPKPTQLNRKIIISAVAATVLILLLSLIFMLNGKKNHIKQASDTPQVSTLPTLNTINTLPSTYSDKDKFNHYINLDKKPQVIEKVPDYLKLEIDQLKSQISELNKAQYQKQKKPIVSTNLDSRARNSQIFFTNGFPSGTNDSTNQAKTKVTDNEFKLSKMNFHKENDVIQEGTIIPGTLQTKIDSSVPGRVLARVRENVYDTTTGKHLLIPHGSLLIGEYNTKIGNGQKRIQLAFNRLIRPDGGSISLSKAQASDTVGGAGIYDKVDNHWGKIIGSAILTSIFDIPSIMSEPTERYIPVSGGGYIPTPPSLISKASSAAAQSISKIGNKAFSKGMNIEPTLTIQPGKRFSIIVAQDMYIPAYKDNDD